MLKKIILSSLVLIGLGLSPVFAAETADSATSQQPVQNSYDPFAWMNPQGGGAASTPNMFDPFSWMTMMSGQPNVQNMNLARPEGWAIFMNPATYPALMNPATYAQFMSPDFYMQFANPNNWMAWMNPAAYGVYMNPNTYMQMMNPLIQFLLTMG